MAQNYYVLGAYWKVDGEDYDMTQQFLKEGCWENGYKNGSYENIINAIEVGARVAIKSWFTGGENHKTSYTRIKAIGTVTANPQDGVNLTVDWDKNFEEFDFEGGGYGSAVSRVLNKEYIKKIFNHNQNWNIVSEIDNSTNTAFQQLIVQYKDLIRDGNEGETYKWQCIKHFQDNFDIDASDFGYMLKKSLKKLSNLLYYNSSGYIIAVAKYFPEETRMMFRNLYNEDIGLQKRIEVFQKSANDVLSKLIPIVGKKVVHQQDERTISFYLSLKYPEKYCFYMNTIYIFLLQIFPQEKACQAGLKLQHFNQLSEQFFPLIRKDKELVKLVKNTLNASCFTGNQTRIIFQDILWRCHEEANRVTDCLIETKPPKGRKNLPTRKVSSKGNGTNKDYIAEHKRNMCIGDLGEKLVILDEKKKLEKLPKLAAKVDKQPDGVGYDILSFDEKGNEIFIEVKTTTGSKNSSFEISSNEVENAKKHKGKYKIYRLFNYNQKDNTAKYYVIHDIDELHLTPTSYEACLKKQD